MTEQNPTGGGHRPLRLGVILAAANTVAEPDLRDLAPGSVVPHVTRLRLRSAGRDEIMAMNDEAVVAAELLSDVQPDAMLFHCTGASALAADDLIGQLEDAAGCPATTTAQAIAEAFLHLGARRPILISPYPAMVNDGEIEFFSKFGLTVVTSVPLDIQPLSEWALKTPDYWEDVARKSFSGVDEADSIILSCTNIRAAGAIARLEKQLGVPVVTSNQAAMWKVGQMLGVQADNPRGGILFGATTAHSTIPDKERVR